MHGRCLSFHGGPAACAISCLTCTLMAARKVQSNITCIAVCVLDTVTTGSKLVLAAAHAEVRRRAAHFNGERLWPLAAWASLSPLLHKPGGGLSCSCTEPWTQWQGTECFWPSATHQRMQTRLYPRKNCAYTASDGVRLAVQGSGEAYPLFLNFFSLPM